METKKHPNPAKATICAYDGRTNTVSIHRRHALCGTAYPAEECWTPPMVLRCQERARDGGACENRG